MSPQEKSTRQEQLYKSVTTHTSHTWANVLVKSLLEKIGSENSAHQTPALDRPKMAEWYQKAGKRLFMFDYDVGLSSFFFFCAQRLMRVVYIGHTYADCQNTVSGCTFAWDA